jgi:hypothetical protein
MEKWQKAESEGPEAGAEQRKGLETGRSEGKLLDFDLVPEPPEVVRHQLTGTDGVSCAGFSRKREQLASQIFQCVQVESSRSARRRSLPRPGS